MDALVSFIPFTPQTLSVIKDLLTILALIVGSIIALFIYYHFAPVVNLRIIPTWYGETKQILVLRFEIENKSRVRLSRPIVRIQVLEQELNDSKSISQWVPFSKNDIKEEEQPISWQEPMEIFSRSTKLYPGELIAVERLYYYERPAAIVHVGLQIELKMGVIRQLLTNMASPWRQTTTCFTLKQAEQEKKKL